MCGMEPIGPLPDVSQAGPRARWAASCSALQSSLNTVVNFSFFITKQMKSDFQNHALERHLADPLHLPRALGQDHQDVSYVSLDEEGALTPQQDGRAQRQIARARCPDPFHGGGIEHPAHLVLLQHRHLRTTA